MNNMTRLTWVVSQLPSKDMVKRMLGDSNFRGKPPHQDVGDVMRFLHEDIRAGVSFLFSAYYSEVKSIDKARVKQNEVEMYYETLFGRLGGKMQRLDTSDFCICEHNFDEYEEEWFASQGIVTMIPEFMNQFEECISKKVHEDLERTDQYKKFIVEINRRNTSYTMRLIDIFDFGLIEQAHKMLGIPLSNDRIHALKNDAARFKNNEYRKRYNDCFVEAMLEIKRRITKINKKTNNKISTRISFRSTNMKNEKSFRNFLRKRLMDDSLKRFSEIKIVTSKENKDIFRMQLTLDVHYPISLSNIVNKEKDMGMYALSTLYRLTADAIMHSNMDTRDMYVIAENEAGAVLIKGMKENSMGVNLFVRFCSDYIYDNFALKDLHDWTRAHSPYKMLYIELLPREGVVGSEGFKYALYTEVKRICKNIEHELEGEMKDE